MADLNLTVGIDGKDAEAELDRLLGKARGGAGGRRPRVSPEDMRSRTIQGGGGGGGGGNAFADILRKIAALVAIAEAFRPTLELLAEGVTTLAQTFQSATGQNVPGEAAMVNRMLREKAGELGREGVSDPEMLRQYAEAFRPLFELQARGEYAARSVSDELMAETFKSLTKQATSEGRR